MKEEKGKRSTMFYKSLILLLFIVIVFPKGFKK